ncbi:2-oxo acid dehydrogenase subunit E2 [Kitasatospora sp. NPDC056184]|uniref:2-oxo acid dehydrogenase subunit E2 n=1 Tax=Kitasatospora sp. NPDC056184 TaxID=3345738 RepID=UPI0035DFF34E
MTGTHVPRQRRHTLYFLEEIRPFSPVFLDTEVDMTRVLEHRAEPAGRRHSVIGYVLHTAARVLVRHPQANVAVRGGVLPKVAPSPGAHAKIALDKTWGGQRVVLSAVLPDLDRADLDEIQDKLEHYRDSDPEQLPQYAGLPLLHKLPRPIAQTAFRRVVRPLGGRAQRMGTFSVTSLGHRAVDGFHSVGGTPVTLGVGRITDRPVVRDGALAIAPTMRLSLAFDHRILDGAEAADILTEVKEGLESFGAGVSAAAPVSAGARAGGAG